MIQAEIEVLRKSTLKVIGSMIAGRLGDRRSLSNKSVQSVNGPFVGPAMKVVRAFLPCRRNEVNDLGVNKEKRCIRVVDGLNKC